MTVLSTNPGMICDPNQVTLVKWKKRDGISSIIPCPTAVAEYSAIMGSVDCFDRRQERHAIGGAYSNGGTISFSFSLTLRL